LSRKLFYQKVIKIAIFEKGGEFFSKLSSLFERLVPPCLAPCRRERCFGKRAETNCGGSLGRKGDDARRRPWVW